MYYNKSSWSESDMSENDKRQIKNTEITNGMNFKSICNSESLITDNCHLAIIGDKNSGKSTFIQYIVDHMFVPYEKITITDLIEHPTTSYHNKNHPKFYIFSHKTIETHPENNIINIPTQKLSNNLDNLIGETHSFIDKWIDNPLVFIFDDIDELINKSIKNVRQFNAFTELIERHHKRDIKIIISGTNRKLMLNQINFNMFMPILLITNKVLMRDLPLLEVYKLEKVLGEIVDNSCKSYIFNEYNSSVLHTGPKKLFDAPRVNVEIFLNFLRRCATYETDIYQNYSYAVGINEKLEVSIYNFKKRSHNYKILIETSGKTEVEYDFTQLYCRNFSIDTEDSIELMDKDEIPNEEQLLDEKEELLNKFKDPWGVETPVELDRVDSKRESEQIAAEKNLKTEIENPKFFENKNDIEGYICENKFSEFEPAIKQSPDDIQNARERNQLKKGELYGRIIKIDQKFKTGKNVLVEMSTPEYAFYKFLYKISYNDFKLSPDPHADLPLTQNQIKRLQKRQANAQKA